VEGLIRWTFTHYRYRSSDDDDFNDDMVANNGDAKFGRVSSADDAVRCCR
jgi:hypothetical protein